MEALEMVRGQTFAMEQAPSIADNARTTLELAAFQVGEERLLERPERVLAIMEAYFPRYMNEGMRSATLLEDTYRRAMSNYTGTSDENRSIFQNAIFEFIDRETLYVPEMFLEARASQDPQDSLGQMAVCATVIPEREENVLTYVHALLDDTVDVEAQARDWRKSYTNDDPNLVGAVHSDVSVDISPQSWSHELHKLCSPQDMLDMLKVVNIESVMIKSAKMLDLLMDAWHDGKVSDASLLHRAHEADFLFAPLLEILGFDELATALKDQARQIRVVKSGNSATLQEAWEITQAAEETKEEIVRLLLPPAPGGPEVALSQPLGLADTYHGMGSVLNVDFGANIAEVQCRTKSVGSAAAKMQEYKDNPDIPDNNSITDALGLNIIANTWYDAAASLRKVYERALGIPGMELSSSFTNGQGISLLYSGPLAVRDALGYVMAPTGIRPKPRQVEASGYETMKLYLKYNGVSIEVQAVTQEAHDANRFGSGARIFKDDEDNRTLRVSQAPAIKKLRSRKAKLAAHGDSNVYDVNGQSRDRSYISAGVLIEAVHHVRSRRANEKSKWRDSILGQRV